MNYGMDVNWDASEIAAFRIYNRLCGEQARAIFAANLRGIEPPPVVPAKRLAETARLMAVVA